MKTNILKRWSVTALAATALLVLSQNANAVAVDLELSLVIDVSGSVSTTEYNLQIDGYKQAFQSGAISNFIQTLGDAGTGGIAVNVIFFSSVTSSSPASVEKISWTQLTTVADSQAFGTAIGALSRTPPAAAGTDIADGMRTSITSFTNGFEGSRLVMDVSGDGTQNTNCIVGGNCIATVQDARDSAATAGITVNGLAIGSSLLTTYYNDNVITSDGFVLTANSFSDFGSAAQDKILREISGAPEPSIVMLLGLGLAGFGFSRRYRNR